MPISGPGSEFLGHLITDRARIPSVTIFAFTRVSSSYKSTRTDPASSKAQGPLDLVLNLALYHTPKIYIFDDIYIYIYEVRSRWNEAMFWLAEAVPLQIPVARA